MNEESVKIGVICSEKKNGKHKLTKVMDIAEIATMAFIASGMTYNAVKYWRVNRKVHIAREWPVSLILKRMDYLSEECRRAVLLVFDRRGYLVRKYPEADVLKRKRNGGCVALYRRGC